MGPFLKWTKEELRQIEQRTRKLMAMNKALHPRDDKERLYVSRKKGERQLANIQDCMMHQFKYSGTILKREKKKV